MELGWLPPSGALLLPVGGTFNCTLRASANWPAGTIDLYFTGDGAPITWAAAVTGTDAVWSKTVAQVAAVLNGDYRTVALRGTPSGGEPAIWYRMMVRPV
jgi:hypothetical protein